jgi:hypothetical protein
MLPSDSIGTEKGVRISGAKIGLASSGFDPSRRFARVAPGGFRHSEAAAGIGLGLDALANELQIEKTFAILAGWTHAPATYPRHPQRRWR